MPALEPENGESVIGGTQKRHTSVALAIRKLQEALVVALGVRLVLQLRQPIVNLGLARHLQTWCKG
jgi:hypothetical protein